MVTSRTCLFFAVAAISSGATKLRDFTVAAKASSNLRGQPAENLTLGSLHDVPVEPPMDPLRTITREAVSHEQVKADPDPKEKETPMTRIMREADDMKKKEEKENADKPNRPFMDAIEIFRVQMCLGRPAVSLHKKCLKYLTKQCSKETTGKGYCETLKQKLIRGCKDKGRKPACNACKKLGYAEECGVVEDDAPTTTTTDAPEDYDEDSDGDGVPDTLDAFPNDPSETEDHDDDGIGDNSDMTPRGETTTTPPETTTTPPPANNSIKANVTKEEHAEIKKVRSEGGTNKKYRKLPSQGFDEYSDSNVKYEDNNQQSADWGKEHGQTEESEEEATARICKENPDHPWCQLYLDHDA